MPVPAPRVALLERLAGVDARSSTTSDSAVVRSVVRNLRRLLNTRIGAAAAQPELGLPAPHELLQGWPQTREMALDAIRRCIQRYEPRLCEVVVRAMPGEPGDQALSFQIAARLVGPGRLAVNLTTAVHADGAISLS
jgi:type VI secretion system protein